MSLLSQVSVCNNHKSCKLEQGKFVFRHGINRENTGNLKIQFDWVPCCERITYIFQVYENGVPIENLVV